MQTIVHMMHTFYFEKYATLEMYNLDGSNDMYDLFDLYDGQGI